ncbi:DUF4826 family protein [Aliidiomarina soli]|uniref:DUF4826 domain-containing protein n=1 Tax=Aliidiomarina soli TaxID=1928574 RepID=A0A432WMJ3_9GAMM|nr:DUF4826 family protein [Aliidiomarina soli]RUO34978.1 DUF4826 domain-containing protein [Aliidiomarina soli]
MSEQQPTPMTEEQNQAWVREQFQNANRYLAERGMLSDRILTKDSRYLIPDVAIWKFKLQDGKKVWVVNGAVTMDHVSADVAKSAREALRHFSLNWQLKAENIHALGDAAGATELKMAQLLIRHAELLYAVGNDERLWQNAPV